MPCHPCRLALWAWVYLRAVFPLDPSISQPLFLLGFSWGEGGLPFQGLQWFCASLVSLLQASRPSRSSLCWGRPSPTSGRWWETRGWVPTWRGAASVALSFLSHLAKSGLCERLLLPRSLSSLLRWRTTFLAPFPGTQDTGTLSLLLLSGDSEESE